MKILGIESSCDDTSVALIEASDQGFVVLSEKTASQIEIHKKYGGVVPEIAGRMHAEKIMPVVEEVMKDQAKPDAIAVTSGPGLITGLLVGVEAAKALSYLWNVPLISINHIEGHIHSPFILNPKGEGSFVGNKHKTTIDKNDPQNINSERSLVVPPRDEQIYPALALIASGGHTELIVIKNQGNYKKIGATVDDAAGECFDKVAKLLNFEYPGGPKISKHAETGNTKAINFPRPMLDKNNYDFSFAGLKTSALYWLRDNKLENINDFCASFEQAIIDVLVGKTLKAIKEYQPKTIILGGGVSANKKLRETLTNEITKSFPESTFHSPSLKYAMDNATMIAAVGYYKALNKDFISWRDIKADPNWEIE